MMENSFTNYIMEQQYYPWFSCVQYYNPKVFTTFNIGNNLEDSTLQLPRTPEVTSKQEETRHHALQSLEQDSLASEQEHKLVTKAQGKSKNNRRKSNDEYRPYERHGKKKSNFLKENRNVLPIKIRQMLSFLTRERKSHQIIQKFILKQGLKFTFNQKRFYAFLKMKKEKVGNYVTLSILKNFLGVEPQKSDLYPVYEQMEFLRIIRVMFKYYLDHISVLCSLTSNRIQSEQKVEHVRVQRQLMEFLQTDLDQ